MSTNKTFNKVQLDVKFTQATTRANLISEENISISFGKLSKWYEALVPTGGSSGQFLGWNSDGTAKWVSNPNTDTKLTQTNTTTSADYRVLLSGNANDTTETTTGHKSTNLKFNPSSGGLYSFGFLWTDITGLTLDINTLTLSDGKLHSRRFIEKTDGGASNITNIPAAGHPFLLEVDLIRWASTTDYITRQRFTNAANGTYSYVRYCTNGTWGSWTTRKYTDTNTKVTSSANHYTPATASDQDKTASASGATAAWGIDVVKGVTLNTDGKGHVTGLSVTSGKIPANPVPSNNVTGSGTSGYLVKWNGTNTITNGPQLGSSTTTYLRNDGSWATPPNTTYSAGDHLSLSSTTFSIASYCKSITDWNSATTNGWYMGSSVTNAPSTAWWFGRVVAHNNKYCMQEVWQFTASTDGHKVPHKMRMFVNNVWGNWVDVTVGTQVPENAVFTDHITTVTSSGSGNAVTAISADANGALTVTKGSTFSLSTHKHGLLHSDLNQASTNGTTGGWSVIGIDPAVTGYVLKSIRVNTTSPNWLSGDYGAGIAFGGSDTKGVISMKYQSPVITFAGGSHNSSRTEPIWYLKISGTSGSTYNLANFYDTSNPPTASEVGALASTTKYAASSSVGGPALSVSTAGEDVVLGTSSSSSDDSGDIVWKYGNGQEKARLWQDNTYTAKAGPQYRIYKSDGTALYSGRLPLADGTSASGTWGISITGNAATATTAANADVTVTNGSTTSTNYGIVFAVNPNTTESNILRKTNDFRYQMKDGAANTEGFAAIVLGNTKKLSEANNKSGNIYLYSSGGNWHLINTTSTTSNITHTLPATSGTILNSGTTSFTRTLSSGTKIGTIKINGTSTDLYCQTNTNTTYTIATGDSNGQIKVTPSSGSAYNVPVKGLDSAAYTTSTSYVQTHSGANFNVAKSGYFAVMANENSDNPNSLLPTQNQWWHILSMSWNSYDSTDNSDVKNWVSQLAIPTYQNKSIGMKWRTNSSGGSALTRNDWVTVLDENNYTSYPLPRNIKHIHTASGTEGTTGWVKIARITVTNLYANHPMTFTIAQRGLMQYRIHLVLVNNGSVAAAAISQFIIARDNSWTDTNNNPRAYIIKPSDGIFDLYIRKTEGYDHIFVVDFTKADGSEGDNYSVTWTNVHAADSEITGGTEAVKKLYLPTTTNYAGSSSVGGAATSANKLNTNAGATNRPVYFSGGVPVQCDTPGSSSFFKGVPLIGTDGVMEIGKYIDFHNTNGSTADYDYRMEITTTTMTLHATGSSNILTIKSPDYTQLCFQTTSSGKAYTASGIICYPLTTSGMTSLFSFGGNVVIGGGEAAKTLYDNNYDTIKTTENEDLYLCADHDIHIVTGCQTYADKSIIEIDTTGKVYLPTTGGIVVKQRSDSNYVSAVTWWKGGTAPGSGEYAPHIGQHNTGGDSSYPGSICILPYKSTTNPWGGTVGLFIRKDHVYIDGVELSKSTHTHNYAGSSSAGGAATNVTGTLTNPTSETSYAVPFHTNPTTGSKSLLNNNGISYVCKEGTASALGWGILLLGNNVNSGTAGNKYGIVRMYPQTGNYYGQIRPVATLTGTRTYQLPDASGNVILGTKGSTSFWGLIDGDASTANWIRATSNGFIPSASASFFQTATSSLGTNTWYFKNSYIQYMNANRLILGAAKTTDGAAKGQLKFFSGNASDATGTVTLECANDAAHTGDYTVKLPTWNGTIPIFEKLFEGASNTVSLSYSDINEYDVFLITVANSNATTEQVTVTSLWISNVAGIHDMPLIWGGAPTSSGGSCNVTSGWIQLSKNSGTTTFVVAHKPNVAQMTSSGWTISSPTYNLYIRKIFGLKAYKRT